jgi:hypothetical protein
MPVELYDPDEDGRPLELYAGDPFDLRLVLEKQDRSESTFSSQLRYRPRDAEIVTECDVASFYVTPEEVEANPSLINGTYIEVHLDGDSLKGTFDGETRLARRRARLDVQEWDGTDGSARQTIAGADLNLVWDVTR